MYFVILSCASMIMNRNNFNLQDAQMVGVLSDSSSDSSSDSASSDSEPETTPPQRQKPAPPINGEY